MIWNGKSNLSTGPVQSSSVLVCLFEMTIALGRFEGLLADFQFAFTGLHRSRFALRTMINMNMGRGLELPDISPRGDVF